MAGRGRPRKMILIDENKSKQETNEMETLPSVHVMVRFLSKLNRSNPMTGETSGADFDEVLSEWYGNGYRIAQAMYIGDTPEGHGIMVVLQRE